MWRFSIAGIVMASMCAAPAYARVQDRVHVSVAEQSLGDALIDLAIQANITISTPREGFGDARSHVVRGAMPVEEALRLLLAHTAYAAERVDAVTFRIVLIARRSERATAPVAPAVTDEVVVLAARQPRTLDRFAAAASVVDADALGRLRATSAEDLNETVAGLGFTNLGPGRNKIMVRGLSDGAFSGRTESTIGVYLGDSRITYGAPDPDLKLVDMQRVEVLRGPQGALYGGGSIGGIYRITPEPVALDDVAGFVGASVETTRDGGVGQVIEAGINVPIVSERLGMRVVGYRESTAGWLDNGALSIENSNHTVREGMRVSVLARIDDSWNVNVSAVLQGIDTADSQYTLIGLGREERSTRVLEPHDNDFSLVSANVRGSTSIGQFESTTTILHHVFDSRFDATGALTRFPAGAGTQSYDEQNDLQFLVEEARLTGVASPIPWTFGAFVSVGRLQTDAQLAQQQAGLFDRLYSGRRTDHINEYAVYGEASLPLPYALEASAGLRIFYTELKIRAVADSVDLALTDLVTDTQSHSGLAPQLRLSWEPDPRAFYYAQVSSGYRSGGFNSGARSVLEQTAGSQPQRRYGPDELWSYEVGFKHRFVGERLRVRGAAFWQVWENVQSDQLVTADLPFTGNAGNAAVRGVEVEGEFAVSNRLTVSAHSTYVDAELVHADVTFPASADAGLPGAPRVSGGGAIDFQTPARGHDVFTAHVGVSFVGGSHVNFSDQSSVEVGDYLQVNANVGYRAGQWRAIAYIENATDETDGTFSFGNIFQTGVSGVTTPLRPRTIGVELNRKF